MTRWDMNEPLSALRVGSKADTFNSLLTAREAANYLRVSLNTLGRMEQRGLIVPYRTPGGHRRYSTEMLRAYLESTRVRNG
jgi:excisionase family DNA binding protein